MRRQIFSLTSLTPHNLLAITQICRFVDGLPLGIVLAARQTQSKSPSEAWIEIEQSPQSLGTEHNDMPDKHRNLWATVRFSYQLLSVADQETLKRLSIFQNSWTLAGAQAVLAEQPSVVNAAMNRLLDHSLISAVPNSDQTRFYMPEIVHRFVRERLNQSLDVHVLAQRHLDFYTQLAEAEQSRITGSEPARAIREMKQEESNVLVALQWAQKSAAHLQGLRLATALGAFWYASFDSEIGTFWLGEMLRTCPNPEHDLHVRALRRAGNLAFQRRDFPLARQFYAQLLEVEANQNSERGLAAAHANLGNVDMMVGNLAPAREHMMTSLDLFTRLEDVRGMAQLQDNLAMLASLCGNLEETCQWQEKAVNLFLSLDSPQDLMLALNNRADTEIALQKLTAAAETLRRAFALMERVDFPPHLFQCLLLHSRLAAAVEQWQVAAHLLGNAYRVRDTFSVSMDDLAQQENLTICESIRANIGTDMLDKEIYAGLNDELDKTRYPLKTVYDAVARRALLS